MAFSHAVISEHRNVATKSFLHPRQGAARCLQQTLVLPNLPSHYPTQMQCYMCDDSLLTINPVLETPESVYIYEEITNQGD